MSELMELVARLTRRTPHVHRTNEGPVIVHAAPLLGQLREALHPSGETGGAPSGSVGSGAPADVAVLDLLARIEGEAREVWWLARSAPGAPVSRLGGTTTEQQVVWAAGVLDGTAREAEMLGFVRAWVHAIERLFDPPRVVGLRSRRGESAACPACGHDRTPVLDPDLDVYVDAPAITVTMGARPRAVCAECGAEWSGCQEVADLAVQMGAAPDVARVLAG